MKTPNQTDKTKTEINFNFNEMQHATLKITRIPLNNDSDNSEDKPLRGRQIETKKIICKSVKCCNSKNNII
jgi:hypothetical protein